MGTGSQVMDGRRARSERSRAAIVDAFLSLLPDGQRVARRWRRSPIAAGVSERSVYRHFPDVDALVHAAIEPSHRGDGAPRGARSRPRGPAGDADPQMSAQRARFYEVALPLRRFTDRVSDDLPRHRASSRRSVACSSATSSTRRSPRSSSRSTRCIAAWCARRSRRWRRGRPGTTCATSRASGSTRRAAVLECLVRRLLDDRN